MGGGIDVMRKKLAACKKKVALDSMEMKTDEYRKKIESGGR